MSVTREKHAGADNDTHPVDLYVGGRIRTRRKFLGMSQDELAGLIGLTFQQVQKYERGANRVSASKLHEIAAELKVPVSYFFDGYHGVADNSDGNNTDHTVHTFLMTTEGIGLAAAFPRIKSARRRNMVMDLVRTLAAEADED